MLSFLAMESRNVRKGIGVLGMAKGNPALLVDMDPRWVYPLHPVQVVAMRDTIVPLLPQVHARLHADIKMAPKYFAPPVLPTHKKYTPAIIQCL
jgi:hypothetical protein